MSNEKSKKPILRLTVIIAAVVVLVFGGGALFAYWLNEPPGGMPGSVIVSVRQGDSFKAIARELNKKGLIRSWFFMDVVSKGTGTAGELQAGRFRIEKGSTTLAIHNLLVSGRQVLVRVTIPDGWTLKQTAARLAAEKIAPKEAFLAAAHSPAALKAAGIPASAKSVAGYLFPDTYYFPEGYPAEKVIATMTENFYRHLKAIYPDYQKLPTEALYKKVVMASIVEREYRVAAEAPVIASVFYNRLAKDMRLQSCATVGYVLTNIEGMPHQTRLYDKELKVPSAYNTYLHWGLPPGPISEPGSVALHAAFYPAHTDYLYFVLENPATGKHFFSKGFAAHLMAQYKLDNLYLKSE